MASSAEIADYYRSYGESSFSADQPIYAEICERLSEVPELIDLLSAHEPEARQPNLLFAAVHYLLLGGLDHPLGEVYAGSGADAIDAFADVILSHRGEIDELLRTRRTQTNEVGRAAVLALMLADAQQRSGQELAWIDLGASGGLNLQVDQFRIDYIAVDDVLTTGPEDAAVRLDCQLRGRAPAVAPTHASIQWRIGVDQTPIDVGDPEQARWLHACVWPTQHQRHRRLAAAIEAANRTPPTLIEDDAASGLALAIEKAPVDTALVVTTTWVWYYLPEPTRIAVLDLLRSSGRPIWWYSLEGRGVVTELQQSSERQLSESHVGRTEFRDGEIAGFAVLGVSHPHGAWLDWGHA